MRRLASIAFGFLLTLSTWGPALAQLQNPVMRTPWNPFKAGGGGGGPAYVGPCDLLTTVTACYCLRACTAAAAGNALDAIQLIRVSDSTTMNIQVKTNGDIDIATATTFCNGTTCLGSCWYDQTGNGHTACAITNQQPTFVFNCVGTLPCFEFDPPNGSSGQCFSIGPNGVPISYPSTFFLVNLPFSPQFSGSGIIMSIGSSVMESEYGVVTNKFSGYNGIRYPFPSTSAANVVYDNAIAFDNTNAYITVNNGATQHGPAGTTGSVTTNLRIGAVNGGGGCEFPFQGQIMEAIYAQYMATPTQITAVYNNQFTYGWH